MKFKRSEKALYRHAINWFLDREGLEANVKLAVENFLFFDGSTERVKKGKYVVYINPDNDPFAKLSTLFHELTHVKQMSEGRLRGWYWMNKKHKKTDYEHQPWEIEAHAVENYLADLYLSEEWSSCPKKQKCSKR